MADGGLCLPHYEDGLYQFELPLTFSGCEAVTSRDAANSRLSEPKKIIMKLPVNRGRVSAHQLKRVLVGPDGKTMGSVNYAEKVYRALEKAPHFPIAGKSAASLLDKKLKVDLLLPDAATGLHATDISPENSPSIPVRP